MTRWHVTLPHGNIVCLHGNVADLMRWLPQPCLIVACRVAHDAR